MARIDWKKTLIVVSDILLGAYIVLVFAAFHTPDKKDFRCGKVSIDIADESTNGFLTAVDIKRRLQATHLYPYGKPMEEVNTRAIEESLLGSAFVRTAECYKTNDGQVKISLTQRLPILRIKAGGDDYYIDDNNKIMRPSGLYTSNLIIATGTINHWYACNYLSYLARTIMGSELWRNQIEQINVLPDLGVELVPRVGNHIIYIGRLPESRYVNNRHQLVADYVDRKLERLRKFYMYGLSVVGWNKYSYINLEFDNQIICKKHNQPLQVAATTAASTPAPASDNVPATVGAAPSAQPKPATASSGE